MNDLICGASAKRDGLSYRFARQRYDGEIGNELNKLDTNSRRMEFVPVRTSSVLMLLLFLLFLNWTELHI
jgi:hypothetical protein